MFLKEDLGLTVVGEVTTARELLSKAGALRPEIIFLDWELPGLAPTRLLAALRAVRPDARIIVIGPPECQQLALSAGADAFIFKTASPAQVRTALLPMITGADTVSPCQGTTQQEFTAKEVAQR
jgi:DNA-binding NarL/FixJ family response regulator